MVCMSINKVLHTYLYGTFNYFSIAFNYNVFINYSSTISRKSPFHLIQTKLKHTIKTCSHKLRHASIIHTCPLGTANSLNPGNTNLAVYSNLIDRFMIHQGHKVHFWRTQPTHNLISDFIHHCFQYS